MSINMSQPMQVLTSHDSAEWYTPSKYIELARAVLGGIDLDPASNSIPQSWIKASEWWDCQGLERDWHGRVFLNPPYGKSNGASNQAVWTKKAIDEYQAGRVEAAILLINSTHGYKWYEDLWVRFPVCLAKERIAFIKPNCETGGLAKKGQTFVYLGKQPLMFRDYFKSIGRVLIPESLLII